VAPGYHHNLSDKDAAAASKAALYTTVPSFTVAFFSITTIPDLM
jgi:hypothetical protein